MLSDSQLVYMVPRNSTQLLKINTTKFQVEREPVYTTSRQQSTTINRKLVMKTKLLNIQGLTKAKAIEIEQLLDKNVILCLTET